MNLYLNFVIIWYNDRIMIPWIKIEVTHNFCNACKLRLWHCNICNQLMTWFPCSVYLFSDFTITMWSDCWRHSVLVMGKTNLIFSYSFKWILDILLSIYNAGKIFHVNSVSSIVLFLLFFFFLFFFVNFNSSAGIYLASCILFGPA